MLASINHVLMAHALRNIHRTSVTVLKLLSMELIVAKVIILCFSLIESRFWAFWENYYGTSIESLKIDFILPCVCAVIDQ